MARCFRARGPFLEGFSLADSAEFEEWQRITRESLEQQLLRTLQQLAGHLEGIGQTARALQFARRQIALEPHREDAHRQVMRRLFRNGRRRQRFALERRHGRTDPGMNPRGAWQ